MILKKYRIDIASPVDYEEVVAQIVIDDQDVALINQDNGLDKLLIEFNWNEGKKPLDYDVFTEALKDAKAALIHFMS